MQGRRRLDQTTLPTSCWSEAISAGARRWVCGSRGPALLLAQDLGEVLPHHPMEPGDRALTRRHESAMGHHLRAQAGLLQPDRAGASDSVSSRTWQASPSPDLGQARDEQTYRPRTCRSRVPLNDHRGGGHQIVLHERGARPQVQESEVAVALARRVGILLGAQVVHRELAEHPIPIYILIDVGIVDEGITETVGWTSGSGSTRSRSRPRPSNWPAPRR